MTTEALARATGLESSTILAAVDAGLLRGRVRLVHGRPMFDAGAAGVMRRAAEIADLAAAGIITHDEAWALLRQERRARRVPA